MSVVCCHTGGFSNWSHKLVWQSADGEKNVNKPAATLRKSRGAEDACDWTEKGVASLRKKRTFEDVGTGDSENVVKTTHSRPYFNTLILNHVLTFLSVGLKAF